MERTPRRFVADVLVVALITGVGKLRALILLPIIARTSGAAEYGVWVQAIGLVTLFAPVLGLNLYQSIIRFCAAQSPRQARRTYLQVAPVSVGLAIGAGAILFALSSMLAPLILGTAASATVMRTCVLLVPVTVLGKLNFGYFRARGNIALAYALEGGNNLLGVVVAAAAFARGYHLTGALIGMLVVQASLALVTTVIIVGRRMPEDASREEKTSDLAAHVRYAVPTVPGALFDWILFLFDRYVIAVCVGATVVGIYSASYAVAQSLLLFSLPFEFVLLPVASAYWDREQRPRALTLISDGLRVFLMASVPTALALAVLGQPVLARIANAEMGAGAPALLPPLLASIVVWGSTRLIFYVFLLHKLTGRVALIVAAAAAVNVVGNLLAVPRWGATAAAWVTLLSYVVALAVTLGWLRPLARLRLGRRWWGGFAAACAAMLATLLLWPSARSLLEVALSAGVAFAVYLAVMLVGGAVGERELSFLRSLLRRPRKAA